MVLCTRSIFLVLLSCLLLNAQGQRDYLEKAQRCADTDSAVAYVRKYMAFAKTSSDTAALVEATCVMARKLILKSLYTRAKKEVLTCLGYPFVKKNILYEGKLFVELGSIHKYEGSFAESLTFYLKAKKIFERISDWNNLVRCKTQLAEYYRKLGRYNYADNYIQDALTDYRKHNLTDTMVLIPVYNRAAAIANESNTDPLVSISLSRKALNLAKKTGNKNAEAISLNELGFSYKNLHRNDSAEILYKRAEAIWFSIGADREAVNAMNNRLMLYAHNNFPKEKVTALCRELISITKLPRLDYPLSDAYGFLYTQALRDKDSGAAFRYFLLYHQNKVQQIARQNDIQVTNITEQYENEKTKNEVKRITDVLTESQAEVGRKNAENHRIYLLVVGLVVLLIVVAILLVRINRDKRKLSYRNKEKDALIQEIHHRVKNNLQFISSLINMQKNTSVDEKEIHTLNDASRRIRAMALVHEMLYNHNGTSGIPIKQYLEELVVSLDQLVNSENIPIEFKLDLAEENFNVSESIALGMITSELVANSMKHAFRDVEKPVIQVSLQKDQKSFVFGMQDNGVGMSDETRNRKTLGLRLIDIFSRQLKGKYEITSHHGFHYQLQFKARG